MTVPRKLLVDFNITRYYHCISRCVRRAFLCGEGYEHRKQWIEDRIEVLAANFAIEVCGYAVMDNHLHLLNRLDPEEAASWSNDEVLRRWYAVYPPKSPKGDVLDVPRSKLKREAKDDDLVSTRRERLSDLGWFMKALKEPLARMANKEDGCKGTFWESRYKSIAILDEEALLATCAYIDLNPVAAGLAATPEASRHTSLRQRLLHVKEAGHLDSLKAAKQSSVAGSQAIGPLEQQHWLCPVEDRRPLGVDREGMSEGFTLGSYLLLVDYTSRLLRPGKARVSQEVKGILDRLGSSPNLWTHRLQRLFKKERLMGHFFSTDPGRLRELAKERGAHHLDNLAGSLVG